MTRDIPAQKQIICDRCQKDVSPGKTGRKQNGIIRVECDALDYSGIAVANGSYSFDLCDNCLAFVAESLKIAMTKPVDVKPIPA